MNAAIISSPILCPTFPAFRGKWVEKEKKSAVARTAEALIPNQFPYLVSTSNIPSHETFQLRGTDICDSWGILNLEERQEGRGGAVIA